MRLAMVIVMLIVMVMVMVMADQQNSCPPEDSNYEVGNREDDHDDHEAIMIMMIIKQTNINRAWPTWESTLLPGRRASATRPFTICL